MAWPPGEHIENVIAQAKELLTDVRILRHDVSQVRAIIDLEGECPLCVLCFGHASSNCTCL